MPYAVARLLIIIVTISIIGRLFDQSERRIRPIRSYETIIILSQEIVFTIFIKIYNFNAYKIILFNNIFLFHHIVKLYELINFVTIFRSTETFNSANWKKKIVREMPGFLRIPTKY